MKIYVCFEEKLLAENLEFRSILRNNLGARIIKLISANF